MCAIWASFFFFFLLFFFTFPMRQLKCKRISTYSHKRWCRGGKGLQRVGEFHAHHPSFPASKVLICVCRKYTYWHLCVCACACASKGMHSLKIPPFGTSDSQILTHVPSIQRLDLFLPLGGPTSPAEKVRATVEECVFSSRLALHEYFKQATWFLSATRHTKVRSLGEQKWNLRLELGFQAPPACGNRQGHGVGAMTEVWLNPNDHVCM